MLRYAAGMKAASKARRRFGWEDYRSWDDGQRWETLHSPTFPELTLDLSAVFSLPIPPAEQIAEIRESAPPYAAGSPGP